MYEHLGYLEYFAILQYFVITKMTNCKYVFSYFTCGTDFPEVGLLYKRKSQKSFFNILQHPFFIIFFSSHIFNMLIVL